MTESTNAARVRVDAAVIGSGQAGPALATALARGGERVAFFEGAQLGGTCVNSGCTPTKTLRKSARIAHLARRAADFGVQVGEVTVDFAVVMARVADIVSASRNGLTSWVEHTPNLTLVRAMARLDGRDGNAFVVRAGDATYIADRVYLNVGTRAALPTVSGLDEVQPLINDSLLALRELPAHLVILGGSYIGVELGQIFRRLGSAVTIIERSGAIVSREDADVSAALTSVLESEGVRIVTSVSELVASGKSGARVTLRGTTGTNGETFEATGTHVLVAIGRLPNTESLGLDSVGVKMDAHGFVPVNGSLETNVPGVFALGDVNRRGAFTHTSWQDHEIVLANHRGGQRSVEGRVATYALYSDPPIGRVGLNETAARRLMATGRSFLVAAHEMRFVSRAKEEGETDGIIKLVIDADTHRFVGATVFGIGGDEIVQLIGAQMAANAPYEVVRDALPIHPTVSEFFPTILGKLKPLV